MNSPSNGPELAQVPNTTEPPPPQTGTTPPPPRLAGLPDSLTAPRGRHLFGRVARLPKNLRDSISQMLDNGIPYPQIIRELGSDGQPLTRKCIAEWKKRGYLQWLREQQLLEQSRARTERAFQRALTSGQVESFQAIQQIASHQIAEVLAELGPEFLKEAITANPLNFFRMLSAFTRITNSGLRCERHLTGPAQAGPAPAQADPEKRKGLSPESLRELNDHLNLM